MEETEFVDHTSLSELIEKIKKSKQIDNSNDLNNSLPQMQFK